jgi:hypothetical protein
MNPYYYLFYKLSRFLNKKGKNENAPIFALSILIGWNIGIVYIKGCPVTQESYQSTYKYGIIAIVIVLFIINYILFLDKIRVKEIMSRYKRESEASRKAGNFLVVLYIVLTLAFIVFI